MQHTAKKLKYLYLCLSLGMIGYGMFGLITQKISAAGKGIFASAWHLQGTPAMVLSGVITFAGIYLFVSVLYTDKNIKRCTK